MQNDPVVVPRLLLIDDDRKFVRLLSGYLQGLDFEISVAHDGAEGIAHARSHQWDLIVLDVMLPRIDGFEVLRQLRTFSQAPVLMLTGRGAEDDLVTGLEGGADDYLSKTASARELLARIRALLRRALVKEEQVQAMTTETQRPLVFGELRLELDARRVSVKGSPVTLTEVEFDLLAVLMRHQGSVRSREQLVHEVSDRRFDEADRSIDVHVASLRKKLGDDARGTRFIRTVRGIGYALSEPGQQDS